MKPISGINSYPFGLTGVKVLAAKDEAGNAYTDLRIMKQASGHRFNLQSTTGSEVYNKIELTTVGTDGTVFLKSTPIATVRSKLGNGQFVIQVYGTDGTLLGYARKITKHRVVLGDGSVVTGIDIAASSTGIVVTGITITNKTVSIAVGATSTIAYTVVPANATDKSVTFSTSAAGTATVNASGVITGVAAGTATITVKNVASNVSNTVAVTVTAP